MNELVSKILKDETDKLAVFINDLINNDFPKLVNILYRVDVDEKKLKQLLKENPGTDAGRIIAEMIIERQIRKIRSREEHKRQDNDSEAERW
jgi:hypothetical protein